MESKTIHGLSLQSQLIKRGRKYSKTSHTVREELKGLCDELSGYSVITHLALEICSSVKKLVLIKHVNIGYSWPSSSFSFPTQIRVSSHRKNNKETILKQQIIIILPNTSTKFHYQLYCIFMHYINIISYFTKFYYESEKFYYISPSVGVREIFLSLCLQY